MPVIHALKIILIFNIIGFVSKIISTNKIQHYDKTRQGIYVCRSIETCSCNNGCHEKALSITYYEHVFLVLVIQHAKLLRRIILSSAACLVITHFSTLFHKWHNFL
jgi:hypothetical protein